MRLKPGSSGGSPTPRRTTDPLSYWNWRAISRCRRFRCSSISSNKPPRLWAWCSGKASFSSEFLQQGVHRSPTSMVALELAQVGVHHALGLDDGAGLIGSGKCEE